MNLEKLIKLHKYAMYNKDKLEKTDTCGCFYCQKIFNPDEIKEWTDKEQTAICPYCSVDSIICNSEEDNYYVTKQDLKAMNKYYFLEDSHEKID